MAAAMAICDWHWMSYQAPSWWLPVMKPGSRKLHFPESPVAQILHNTGCLHPCACHKIWRGGCGIKLPMANVMNYYKFSGIRWRTIIILQFRRSEVWNGSYWAKIKMTAGLGPSKIKKAPGENPLHFYHFEKLLAFLGSSQLSNLCSCGHVAFSSAVVKNSSTVLL